MEPKELTLDERGLNAVSEFLRRIIGKPEKRKNTLKMSAKDDGEKEKTTDIWEPPIDNEVK